MKKLALIVLSLVVLSGCSTLDSKVQTASKSLLASKSVVLLTAKTGSELCAKGTLKQAQCDRLKDGYAKSKVAYDAASDAMIVALSVGATDDTWAKFQIALDLFKTNYDDFYKLGTEFNIIKGASK